MKNITELYAESIWVDEKKSQKSYFNEDLFMYAKILPTFNSLMEGQ